MSRWAGVLVILGGVRVGSAARLAPGQWSLATSHLVPRSLGTRRDPPTSSNWPHDDSRSLRDPICGPRSPARRSPRGPSSRLRTGRCLRCVHPRRGGRGVRSHLREYVGRPGMRGSTGTAALTIALRAAGIGPGDEVIVPGMTFIASALAVMHAGATPVLCDVRDADGLIDVESAAACVTGRNRGDHAGPSLRTALRHGLCPAAGRALRTRCDRGCRPGPWGVEGGSRAGAFGLAAGFSFYPGRPRCPWRCRRHLHRRSRTGRASARLRDLGRQEDSIRGEARLERAARWPSSRRIASQAQGASTR